MNDSAKPCSDALSNIATIIALDFDGVLHPASCGPTINDVDNGTLLSRGPRLFERMDMFCDLLSKHPDTRIVLSTSWRRYITPDELLSYFPLPVRDSIIGITPVDERDNRRREIGAVLSFLQLNDYTGRLLILDDTSTYFQANDFIGFQSVSDNCWGFSMDVPTVYLTNRHSGLTHYDIKFISIILTQSSTAFASRQSV